MSISSTKAWFIWMIASIFYAYQYIIRVMPNIMMNDIMQQFNIDAALFGQFSGVYYLGYALMHLPLGLMLDRFGPKKIMSICILFTALGLLPILLSDNWIYPVIGRIITGIGSSAAILGTFKIVRMTFKEHHFTRMLSFSVTIGLIGAIYGGGPVGYMCTQFGSKTVIEIFIAIGILLALITFLTVPEVELDYNPPLISDIKSIFLNKKVLFICIFAGLMVGPLEGFADVWGSAFLKNVYNFDSLTANYLPSIIFIGMCFGASILSIIAEKTGYYLGSIIGAGTLMFIIFTMLVAGIMTINSISIGFILVGICSAYQIVAIYKASTYVSENVAGLTTAVANMIIMIFGYAFHSVIGGIINMYSTINTTQAFTYGISIIPITLFISVIGFSIIACIDRNNYKALIVK